MEMRAIYADCLDKLMQEDKHVVLLDADLAKASGTVKLRGKYYGTQIFDCGVAEQNMASIAAGLSSYGFKPWIESFTPFASRRICDQIAISIAYAKQNVKIVGTDPGMMLNHCSEAKALSGGRKFQEKVGCIEIGDNVFIGSGSRILYNVRIGSNVVVGSGSIVNRDIPDNSVVAGIPAKVIGSFDLFVEKHINETDYPKELSPSRETVSDELEQLLWADFHKARSKE